MTNPEHDRRVRRLFDDALELPEADRSAFLVAQCPDDAELRARVGELLAAADDEHFLGSPTFHPLASAAEAIAAPGLGEGPGARIGPYLLVRQLGEGGFGAVFLAEQEQPVARQVALKIIKLGMDTRQVVARFEQERQALAMMDHPNIARVLDAGATATGRPYFVMDLVQGAPITDYCDQHSLTIDARLALFTQVCEAVQHAHQKGIIHRDLKPGNVLVTTHDGRAVAKVIDFGIAKATAQKLTDKTLLTAQQQVLGTLQYMSPEQAEGSPDIDTRSDVYSLGVLLYELLTGSTPFDAANLGQQLLGEILRLIREVEPQKPSTRLSESRATIASIAARRRVEPGRLGGLLRGDLDWIVMRALEKDIARRYATPHDLAQDLRHHLAGEAVVAAPPSKVYRVRKFVRRNRGLVAAIAAVALALLGGAIAFATQARIAGRERDAAATRAAQLAQVASFQEQMLVQLDATDVGVRLMSDIRGKHGAVVPERADAFAQELAHVNATDVAVAIVDSTFLAPAVAAVTKQFAEQPLVAATLRQTLAKLYAKVGDYTRAEQLLRMTLETRQGLLGGDHVETLLATNDLADVLDSQGRYKDAEPLHRQAVAGRRQQLGADHPDAIQSLSELGGNLRYQGRFAEAEPLLRDAVAAMRAVRGNEHRSTLICINTLGYALIEQGRSVETEPYWREAYETGKRVFGADDPDVIIWTNNYGGVLGALGRQSDAEVYYREAMSASGRVRGLDHPGTATLTQSLGTCLQLQKKHAEAEALARTALAVRRRVLGNDHPETLGSSLHLGAALRDQGKLAEAEEHLRIAWTGLGRRLGKEHPDTLRAGRALATFSSRNGRAAEAEALYGELLATSQSVWGAEHPDRLFSMLALGNLLNQERRLDEAEAMLRDTLTRRRKSSGDTHIETLVVRNALAGVYLKQGRLELAEAETRSAADRAREKLGDENSTTLLFVSDLGKVVLARQRYADAEPLLREATAGLAKTLGPKHSRTATTRGGLGRALLGLARFADAEAELLAAESALTATDAASAEVKRTHAGYLVDLYTAWHAAQPAAGHDGAAATWRERTTKPPETSGK